MAERNVRVGGGGIGARLRLAKLRSLKEELLHWRLDDVRDEMRKYGRKRGLVLDFIRGLRLSAGVIYALRVALSDTGMEVSWGHVLDRNEAFCSPECDVIIHRPGVFDRWNGSKDPIMDFSFVAQDNAVAVVSCKSLVSGVSSIDVEYCSQMRVYVRNVLLFAECCRPTQVDRLTRTARDAGYRGFWYLYTLARGSSEPEVDERKWTDFLNTVHTLASRAN